MFSTVPLRHARISNTQVRIRLSWAFPCALFRCMGSEKAHVRALLNKTFKRKAFKTRKNVVNKTYNYE